LALTEPKRAPSEIMQSWEMWLDTNMRRVRVSSLAVAREASANGDEVNAGYAITQGVLGGLSEDSLRRDLSGVEASGPVCAGSDLRDRVCRFRRSHFQRLVAERLQV
jgi:hypothetical protein